MSFFAAVAASLVALSPVSLPPTAGVADYQLGGAYTPASDVQIVTRDSTESADPDRYSICYVNAFQTQPGTLSWWKREHPSLLLRTSSKKLVRDRGWPDEILLDIGTAKKRTELAKVADDWFSRCAEKGFQAVEPDNLDSYTRSGKRLSSGDAVRFARTLADLAHRHGLAVAQKNSVELTDRDLGMDFAVAEECEVYRECGEYVDTYGTALIEIEYTDNGRAAYDRACAARHGAASILLRDRDVVPRGSKGYVYEHC